jgi:hypothetical protein
LCFIFDSFKYSILLSGLLLHISLPWTHQLLVSSGSSRNIFILRPSAFTSTNLAPIILDWS